MSIPQLDPAVEQEAQQALGVIIKTPKARSILAASVGIVGAALTGATSAVGYLTVTAGLSHIPSWVPISLAAAYAAYTPVAAIAAGIWKANVR